MVTTPSDPSRLVTETIQRLQPYSAGKPIEELERELGITGACKLASNENPLGPSVRAKQAAAEALNTLHRYPDADAFRLRHTLAARLGVEPSELVFGNGSNELLELLVRTFATPEHHLVFAQPSFVVYRMAALAQGVPFSAVPLVDQVHDLDAMLAAVTERTRLVFIANPNNPTGTYVTEAALRAFLQALPAHVIVVIDEAYFEYAVADDYPDSLQLRDLHPRLVVVRTFSKAYGLAALRLGYAVCSAELCGYLNRVRAPFNANSVAQAAAIAAFEDEEHLQRVVEQNRAALAQMQAGLDELGLKYWPSQANFVLVDFGQPAVALYEQLLREGVITRPIPPLPTCLRISAGLPEENQRLLTALKSVLKRGAT